jgi:hypothetical protein
MKHACCIFEAGAVKARPWLQAFRENVRNSDSIIQMIAVCGNERLDKAAIPIMKLCE